MRWGSACPPEGGFWLPGLAVSYRPHQVNIAFGTGRHFCAGHAFSRALIRIAIEDLLQRFSRLALDLEPPPEFRGWEFRAPRRAGRRALLTGAQGYGWVPGIGTEPTD
jgi:hypothetical protein